MIATSLSLDTTRTIHAQAEAANSSDASCPLARHPDWSCTHLCFNRSSAVLLDPTTSTRTFRTGSDLLTLSPSARLHETLIQARPTKNARLAHEQSIVSDRPGSHAGRPGISLLEYAYLMECWNRGRGGHTSFGSWLLAPCAPTMRISKSEPAALACAGTQADGREPCGLRFRCSSRPVSLQPCQLRRCRPCVHCALDGQGSLRAVL